MALLVFRHVTELVGDCAGAWSSHGLDAANRPLGLGAYAGYAPTPWRSGSIDHEQGMSKAGNPRLRTTMLQVAWLWLQHQPQSALARWYHARVGSRLICAFKCGGKGRPSPVRSSSSRFRRVRDSGA